MRREVVITGVGAVTACGTGSDALLDALESGGTAIGPMEAFDASAIGLHLAGEATGFNVRDVVPKSYRKATKVMARDIELAVGAAADAIERAGLVTRAAGDDAETTYPAGRLGCCIGAGLIAAEMPELAVAGASSVGADGRFSLNAWGETGMGNLTPLWLLKYLPNMLACHVTILHGAEGPSNTITCAEASGLLSVGESARIIERGDADVCFAGSAESKFNHTGLARMKLTGRLAETAEGDAPGDVLRPFDPSSRGTILGEGAGLAILESAETAKSRGAKIIARVSGFGAAQSPATHLGLDLGDDWPTGDAPTADPGLISAIRRALADSGLEPGDIGAVVPRGSGVPAEDASEKLALEAVFGSDLPELVVWTPITGDCVAGNGGVQAAIGAGLVERGRAEHVLVCSSALGGQNAAVVLSKPTE